MKPRSAGFDGQRELVAREVPDPYDGEHLAVVVNVRESPLEHLMSRGIIDEAQKAAGDRFRSIYERSRIGGAKAIDYRRPKVDGGIPYDPMLASTQEAAKTLVWVRSIVGERDYSLLVSVAGLGLPLRQQTPVHGLMSPSMRKRAELFTGMRFREALSLLAHKWGFGKAD